MFNPFGPPALVVNPSRLEALLEVELPRPDRTAVHIVALAKAFDATLVANPAIESLVHDQVCFAIAGLYGAMLAGLKAATSGEEALSQSLAVSTLARVEQIVRLAGSELPVIDIEPAGATPSAGDSAVAIEEILSEL